MTNLSVWNYIIRQNFDYFGELKQKNLKKIAETNMNTFIKDLVKEKTDEKFHKAIEMSNVRKWSNPEEIQTNVFIDESSIATLNELKSIERVKLRGDVLSRYDEVIKIREQEETKEELEDEVRSEILGARTPEELVSVIVSAPQEVKKYARRIGKTEADKRFDFDLPRGL